MTKKPKYLHFKSNSKDNVNIQLTDNIKSKHIKILFNYFLNLVELYYKDIEFIESCELDILFEIRNKDVISSKEIENLSINEQLYLLNEITNFFDTYKENMK